MRKSDPSGDLAALKQILLTKSVRTGDFTLVSGQKSDIYVDSKLTTYSADAVALVGRIVLDKIEARGWLPDAVGGLTLGADPIAFAVARESLETGRPVDAFVVRKEAKKHGTQRFIEGLEVTGGRKVVIIDDVCSTGGSTVQAIEKAMAAGMQILGAICLVDREMGAPELLKTQFGCDLESVFTLSDLRGQDGAPASAQTSQASR
jgi:orotate phosphoribosyltransferase